MYDWRDILAFCCLIVTCIGCILTSIVLVVFISDRRLTEKLENLSKNEQFRKTTRPDAENKPGNSDM
jgi:hypothetical protein